jgi:D-glycero-D-manno-heptose 1,7-bisphosphate phosphatase
VSDGWERPRGRGPWIFRDLAVPKPVPGSPAVFLDRDGTLNEAVPDPDSGLPESPLSPADVRLIPGAADAVSELAAAGYVLVCVSNQPSAAKGKATIRELLSVHDAVLSLLAPQGVRIAMSFLCPHHPEGGASELSGPCDCRKPAPGMLLQARDAMGLDLASSWMLGDTDTDVLAGRAAGCRTVLIDYPGSAHKRRGSATADLLVADLHGAVGRLLEPPFA